LPGLGVIGPLLVKFGLNRLEQRAIEDGGLLAWDIVLGEAHLRHILRTYARYYNHIRTHRSLDKDAPVYRPVQRIGSINSHAILGGLHHHYVRV
jgi:hypothetical protein